LLDGGIKLGRAVNRDSVIGLPVICEQTGKRLGVVEDIQYDANNKRIKGIIVSSTGYRTKNFFIDFNDIHAFGEMAIITKEDCQKKIHKEGKNNIVGKTIIKDDGQELGTISNIIFNPDDGHVEGYEISKGILDDLVAGRSILSGDFQPQMGGDVIVIPVEENIELKSNNRGILNILSDSN